jgi:hypothetical protein
MSSFSALRAKPISPTGADLKSQSLKPGVRVDIVIGDEIINDIRASELQKIYPDGTLCLAQTRPALDQSHVGKPLKVTFLFALDRQEGPCWLRTGYKTVLSGISKRPQGECGFTESILVPGPSELTETDLRMHVRMTTVDNILPVFIAPPNRQELVNSLVDRFSHGMRSSLMAGTKRQPLLVKEFTESFSDLLDELKTGQAPLKASAVDISLGGIRFVHTDQWEFPVASRLKIALKLGQKDISLEGVVVRWGEFDPQGGDQARFTCLRFTGINEEQKGNIKELMESLVQERQGYWAD